MKSDVYFESPWRDVGTKVAPGSTLDTIFDDAGLNYHVRKEPIYYHGEAGSVSVPQGFATVRDDGTPLGVVGRRYQIVNNSSFRKLVSTFMDTQDLAIETAGTFNSGAKAWILARLPDYVKVAGKDALNKMLLFVNSFDGSTPLVVKFTTIRVICWNTLQAAMRQRNMAGLSIAHTESADVRMSDVLRTLQLSNEYYNLVHRAFDKLALHRITDAELIGYVKRLVPDNPEADKNTRAENTRSRILGLYESGRGAELGRGTLWGAYNAITEYTDHVAGGDKRDRALKSMLFGAAADLKESAFALAMKATEGFQLNAPMSTAPLIEA